MDGLEKSGSKDPHADYQKPSQLRDFLTFLALSFHAIFEGMALGLEEHTEDVWILFAGERDSDGPDRASFLGWTAFQRGL